MARNDKNAAKAVKTPKLPAAGFGDMKRGIVTYGFKRNSIRYSVKDHYSGMNAVHLDPAKITVRIETAEEATKHMKGGRVGGGLIAGGILLGPLGAAIGGGLGAAARKSYNDKYAIIEDDKGETYSILLKGSLDLAGAQNLRKAVNEIKRHADAS